MAVIEYPDGVRSGLGEDALVITMMLCSFIFSGMALQNWATEVASMEDD